MENLLESEWHLSEICRIVDNIAALLAPSDRDTQERLARIKRDAEAIRLRIPATMAAA